MWKWKMKTLIFSFDISFDWLHGSVFAVRSWSFIFYNCLFLLQAEVFPYPEIGNEEVEEIKQLVAPVEKFFNEEGEAGDHVNAS